MSTDSTALEKMINELADGDQLFLQFEKKDVALVTIKTFDDMSDAIESYKAEIDYLSSELSLLYRHINQGDKIDFDDEDGRVTTAAVTEYLLRRSIYDKAKESGRKQSRSN